MLEFNDINEFLYFGMGFRLDRDIEDKLTMYVKNFDDTKWNKKKQPLPCYVMEKLDGVCGLAVNIDGNVLLFSRTGRKLKNVSHLEKYLAHKSRPNTVSMVELCHYDFSLEEVSGFCNPNRVEPIPAKQQELWLLGSFLGIYDIISLEEFIAGKSTNNFEQRLHYLETYVEEWELDELIVPRYILAHTEEEVDSFFNQIESEGGEGVVRCLPEGLWQAGYKNHDKTKKVRGVDFDLEIIGVEIGTKGKHAGIMNKLVVRWRKFGDPLKPAVNLPVDGRFDLEFRKQAANHPEELIGKIAHVHALQLGSAGSLRLAKVRAIRTDKFVADL